MDLRDNGLFKIGSLPHDKEVPSEIVENCQDQIIFSNGRGLFKFQNLPIGAFVSDFKPKKASADEFFAKNFGDVKYLPNKVYILKDRMQDIIFPKEEFLIAMKYFRDIYDEHKCEACVLLMLHPEKKRWKVQPVIQIDCNAASVKYLTPVDSINPQMKNYQRYKAVWDDKRAKAQMLQRHKEIVSLQDEGWVIYGTIHSHCNFAAFHSGVDDADELNFDGLHITIGDVRNKWSYSARLMVDTASFPREINEILGQDPKSFESEVEDIVVDKRFYDSFFPKIQPSHIHSGPSGYTPKMYDWTKDNNWWSQGYAPSDSPIHFNSDDEDDDEIEFFYEDDYVRLYSIEEGICLIVDANDYELNEERFPPGRFHKIDFGPVPEELIRSHENYAEAVEEISEELMILDDPRINPRFPSNEVTPISFRASDTIEISEVNCKAARKE